MPVCSYCGRNNKHAYKGSCGGYCPGPNPGIQKKNTLDTDQITELINMVDRRMRDSDISAWTYGKLLNTLDVLKEMKKCST